MSKHRIEKDSLGEVEVPTKFYYGAQTQRSLHNFSIGKEKIPIEVVYALVLIKQACAEVNAKLDLLALDKKDLIIAACKRIKSGDLDEHFPLKVWQTGSGTQTNMNVNEVISNLAIESVGGTLGSKKPIHPNDDVNMSQSSNDTFPSAMHISAKLLVHSKLIPSLKKFKEALHKKSKEFRSVIKVGRTHMMDAAPLTFGQEFSGYEEQIKLAIEAIEYGIECISNIAIGGTAVGTGLNAPKDFGEHVAERLSTLTGQIFTSSVNKFSSLSGNDGIVTLSSALRQLATVYYKIASDIRLSASGPRCGIAELVLPANEPGSSIMPGKVNPTQCEAMTMVAVQVMGNDSSIAIGASQGQFQLNVMRPMMIYNLIQSIHLLADTADSFREKCLEGLKPNIENVQQHLNRSLMQATALNREIGYDQASQIVKKAAKENLSLKEAALSLELLSEKQFDEIVDPEKMI